MLPNFSTTCICKNIALNDIALVNLSVKCFKFLQYNQQYNFTFMLGLLPRIKSYLSIREENGIRMVWLSYKCYIRRIDDHISRHAYLFFPLVGLPEYGLDLSFKFQSFQLVDSTLVNVILAVIKASTGGINMHQRVRCMKLDMF